MATAAPPRPDRQLASQRAATTRVKNERDAERRLREEAEARAAEAERRLAERDTEPMTAVNGNGAQPGRPSSPETEEPGSSPLKRLAVAVVMVIALIGIALLASSALNGDDKPSKQGGSGQAPPDQSSPSEQAALERVQDRYENMTFSDFQDLAKPAVNHSQNGRFIDRKVNGLEPAQKLDTMLTAAAEDKVTLVGLTRTFVPGAFTERQLDTLLQVNQDGRFRYEAWSALRDRFTGSATLGDITLNGPWFNTSVNEQGDVSGNSVTWHNEPGTEFQLASTTVNGKYIPAEKVVMRDLCANVQVKERSELQRFIPQPQPQPQPTPPGDQVTVPPDTVTPPPGAPPPTPTIPTPSAPTKEDTPTNTLGPTGNGQPQPVGETEPPGTTPGNPTPPPGGSIQHNPPPAPPPPPGDSPPAGNGGTTGCPTCP